MNVAGSRATCKVSKCWRSERLQRTVEYSDKRGDVAEEGRQRLGAQRYFCDVDESWTLARTLIVDKSRVAK